MRPPGRAGAHLAPFLLGAAAAAAGEVAAALLLYAGAGLVSALTLVLGAELAALGAGLWSAPSGDLGPGRRLLVSLRRRWLFALVAFSCAAGFAAAWPMLVREGATALGQGLGLALLAALPLYAVGAVLGTLAAVRRRAGGPGGVAVGASFGAAAGVLATGVLLTRHLRPVTLLLLCVSAVAGAALADAAAAERAAGDRASEPSP